MTVDRENNFRKVCVERDVIEWLDPRGESIAIIKIEDGGINFQIRKGAAPIEEWMDELNQGSIYPNIKINHTMSEENKDEEYVRYRILPAHNWNCAKRDFQLCVDSFLKSEI
jgi:hypothetical protein